MMKSKAPLFLLLALLVGVLGPAHADHAVDVVQVRWQGVAVMHPDDLEVVSVVGKRLADTLRRVQVVVFDDEDRHA